MSISNKEIQTSTDLQLNTNELGYYEMRLESIGGLGANLCGKMLGELGLCDLGLNSANFSSYGSEKPGTPVKGYIRYCEPEREIRVHSPVEHPHLLAIFHEALMQKEDVLSGVASDTKILLNTSLTPKQVSGRYGLESCEVYCIPAQDIAMESKSRINVVMLGAIGRVMGFVTLQQLENICRDTLGRKYPAALEGNLEGLRLGYKDVKSVRVCESGKQNSMSESACAKGIKQNERGYRTMPIGGINLHIGNSVTNDLSSSRQGYFPLFIKERCINCAQCDITCPDMVFQFEKGTYKGKEMMVNQGLDYYHCKGCLRCVDICPVNALVAAKDADYKDKPHRMPNRDLLRLPEYYEECGADGYITSEAFLTEKRMGGGEV